MANETSGTTADTGSAASPHDEASGLIAALYERARSLRRTANFIFVLIVAVIVTGIALFSLARDFAGGPLSENLSQQFLQVMTARSKDAARVNAEYRKAAELADDLIGKLRAGCEDRGTGPTGGSLTIGFLTGADMLQDKGLSKIAALLGDPKTSSPFYLSIATPAHFGAGDPTPQRMTESIAVTKPSALKCIETLRTSIEAEALASMIGDAQVALADYEALMPVPSDFKVGRGAQSPLASAPAWHFLLDTVVMRVASIILVISIVLVLLRQSRFHLTLAGFYQARADALRLCRTGNLPADKFAEIALIMTPHAFAEAPPAQLEEVSSLLKKLTSLSVTKK